MKKKHIFQILGFLLISILLFLPATSVHAASGSLTASSTTIEVGQSVTLTVTVSGEDVGGFQANLSSGGTVASATSNSDSATFTPSSAGTYTITASGTISLTNLQEQGFTTNAVTITVTEPAPAVTPTPSATATSTATPTPTATPAPTATSRPGTTPDPNATEPPAKTPMPEEGDKPTPAPTDDARPMVRSSSGDIYIAVSLPNDVKLPENTEKGTVVIKNRYVEAFSLGGNDYYIVYTTDKNGNNGQLRVFNSDTETFVKSSSMTIPAQEFKIFSISSSLAPPAGYSIASIQINDETVLALKDDSREGFYLVLAQDESGQFDYYIYDEVQQTLQRYITTDEQLHTVLPTPEPEPTQTHVALEAVEEQPATSPVNMWKIVAISSMLCSILLLGALSVVLFVNRKRTNAEAAEEALVNDILTEEENIDETPFPDEEDDPFAAFLNGTEDVFDKSDEQK